MLNLENYIKLFKKYQNDKFSFVFRTYNPDEEKYFEVIKTARSEGLNQVIINSEIMTDILYSTLEHDGLILKINMTDNTDRDINDNICSIIPKLKKDRLLFLKLKEQLEWAAESNSIDIKSVEVYVFEKKYEVYSNGIIIGNDFDGPFKNLIKDVVENYFYE